MKRHDTVASGWDRRVDGAVAEVPRQRNHPDRLHLAPTVLSSPYTIVFQSLNDDTDRPQLIAATAQVIFHRFYHVVSFKTHTVFVSFLLLHEPSMKLQLINID